MVCCNSNFKPYRFYTNWYNSEDGCVQNVQDFKDCKSYDNNADVSVYKGDVKVKSCGTLTMTYGLEQSDQIYTLVCDAEGDNVKLSKDTSGNFGAWEFVIVGPG